LSYKFLTRKIAGYDFATLRNNEYRHKHFHVLCQMVASRTVPTVGFEPRRVKENHNFVNASLLFHQAFEYKILKFIPSHVKIRADVLEKVATPGIRYKCWLYCNGNAQT